MKRYRYSPYRISDGQAIIFAILLVVVLTLIFGVIWSGIAYTFFGRNMSAGEMVREGFFIFVGLSIFKWWLSFDRGLW